eukprot:Tamp_09338.p1 GENE.Tamp_09338~~Tamp_09338.p1  ORF type:complete len:474 (+),score=57.70 Tamp_09338:126-1424(+)
MAPPGAPAGLWLAGVVIAAQLHCAIPAAAPQTWEVLAVAAGDYGVRQPLAFRGPLGCYGGSPDGVRTRAPLRAASCAPALCRAPRSRPPTSRGPCMLQDMHAAELEVRRRGGHGGAWSAPRRALPPCAAHGSFSRPQPQGLSHGRGRGGRVLLAALSTSRKSELILKEVKTVDGVDVNIKLESLGGSRRRISGGLLIEAPPRAIWDVLTNYNQLHEYIPNIAASGAQLQPNGRVRIEQVGVISPTLRLTTRIVLEVLEEPYQTLTFSKVESREFLEFEGTYSITKMDGGGDQSYLEYSVEALPLPLLPIQLVQGKIKQEVPPMLAAVRCNAIKYNELRIQTLGPAWMEDLPVPVSESYRKKLDGPNAVSDDRPSYSAPGMKDRRTPLYTIEGGAPLPFTSLAVGLLQAVVSFLNLLPGFKPLPGDADQRDKD